MTKLDRMLQILRKGPATADDFSRVCAMRNVKANIWRLREAGHEIILHPAGNRFDRPTYELVRLAGDLRTLEEAKGEDCND
jgi:hypothetical protein